MLRFSSIHSLLVAECLPSALGHAYIVSSFYRVTAMTQTLVPSLSRSCGFALWEEQGLACASSGKFTTSRWVSERTLM